MGIKDEESSQVSRTKTPGTAPMDVQIDSRVTQATASTPASPMSPLAQNKNAYTYQVLMAEGKSDGRF